MPQPGDGGCKMIMPPFTDHSKQRPARDYRSSGHRQSADFNPIENIWLVLKNYVRKHLKDISTVADLRCGRTICWNNLSAVHLHSLYNSLPRGCQPVVSQKGFITKY
jgi:hypothetical protein